MVHPRVPLKPLAVLVTTLAATGLARASELDLLGVASGRALVVEGQRSWLEGGFGRLTEGAGEPFDAQPTLRGQLHLGFDWKPAERWLVHAHGVAQGEPPSYGGQRAGLVEGFVQFRPELTAQDALRLRAGLFFPQTSLENVDALWQSPYTVTLSALNTWIGEEVRLTGLEAVWIRKGERDRFELGGAVFGVNDPAGALLGWRGWALGDRLTSVGEVLPLPPLSTFGPGQGFADQRDDGTRAMDELDSRPGYEARARFTRPEALRIQVAFYDNRADRRLRDGQYAWQTRFAQAGVETKLGPSITFLAEGAIGDTGMGPAAPGGPQVQVRFRTGYALLSWARGDWRVSGRVDGFDNDDRDGTGEPNQESGWEWTAAAFWKPRPFVRLGLEYVSVRGARPAAAFSGADPDAHGRRALFELRLAF